MATLEIVDAALDYQLTGADGSLVVQLHGLTSSRTRDAAIGLDLARALDDHRVLRYDARGHGRSTGTPDPTRYTWPALAGDLLTLLDHVAPGERVHGVGGSMGTGTLLHTAVRHPSRFASLTLVVPPTAYETRAAKAASYRANAELVEREGMDAFVAQARMMPEPPALEGAPQSRPSTTAELLPSLLRGAAKSDLPPIQTIAQLHIPTLILAWADDPDHPVRTAELLHHAIRASRLVVARTPYGIMAWPALFADHVTAVDQAAAEQAA